MSSLDVVVGFVGGEEWVVDRSFMMSYTFHQVGKG